jgi:Na+/serine symporter
VLQGVFLLIPSLYFISRLFLQVYLTYLVVNLISNVLIIVYHLLRDLFGEFQVLTCETLGGFTIYFTSSCLVNVYISLELVSNTCWVVVA